MFSIHILPFLPFDYSNGVNLRIKDAIWKAKDLEMFPKNKTLTDIVTFIPQEIDLSGFLFLSDNILQKIREQTVGASDSVR